jgi:RNA polymerase sigma-70 factor (ECF subfamily)
VRGPTGRSRSVAPDPPAPGAGSRAGAASAAAPERERLADESGWHPADPAALVELHRRYRRRLEAVAYRVLHDRDEAEDVVQRLFLTLPSADFRGASSIWTYLYRAVVNGAVSVLRARRRREGAETELRTRLRTTPDPALLGGDPEARVLEGEILSAVAAALLDVRPQHRRALVLRIVWGLSNTEIARREGVPLPTVGTWLRRGREELRGRLGPLLRDLDRGEDDR